MWVRGTREENTYGADTQVNTLEVRSTVNIETLIDNTTLLSGLHGASTERVPGGLDVVGNPVVDGLVVLLGVLDVLVDLAGIVGLAGSVPGTHVDADGEAVGQELLRGPDVDVLARGGRVGVEVRVVGGELAAEGW